MQPINRGALVFFTYWTNPSGSLSPEREAHFRNMVEDWRAKIPEFTVFGDDAVLPILKMINPILPKLFERIRIPACKSDLARLALLFFYGGLYVDAHTGTGDGFRLSRIMGYLAERHLVLFDKRVEAKSEHDKCIVNGAIAARRNAAPLYAVLANITDNLIRHEAAEAKTDEYVPYNIFILTGAWGIASALFDRTPTSLNLKQTWDFSTHVEPIDPAVRPWPFVFYKHYGYREPGRHWSERQKEERLFNF